jgi:hyperosmotically inducible protein
MKKGLIKCGSALSLALALAIVAPGCAGDRHHQSTGEYIDDSAITSKVKAALLADKNVSGLAVKVKTYKRVVQLSGFVDNQDQKQRAGEIARGIHGVEAVKNDITIK